MHRDSECISRSGLPYSDSLEKTGERVQTSSSSLNAVFLGRSNWRLTVKVAALDMRERTRNVCWQQLSNIHLWCKSARLEEFNVRGRVSQSQKCFESRAGKRLPSLLFIFGDDIIHMTEAIQVGTGRIRRSRTKLPKFSRARFLAFRLPIPLDKLIRRIFL